MGKKTTLGGDAVRLTVSKITVMCINVATSMLLARFRTLEEYGTYSQLMLTINLFTCIFMLGLPSSVNYFLARAEDRAKQQRFLSVYYTLNTLLSLIMGVALVCTVPLIEMFFKNPAIRNFAFFLAFFPWANIISNSIENILVFYKRTTFLVFYRIINSILVLGMVLAAQMLGMNFREYMVGSLGVYSVFALSVYMIVAKLSGGLRFSCEGSQIKKILVFSLPLGLSSIIGTLDLEMDKLLIGRMMSTEELAIYSNAAKELPLTVISSSITAVLLPQISKMIKNEENGKAVELWGAATELALVFMGLFVSGIFTYAEEVVELLYSPKYLAGVPVFRIYTLVLLLRVTYFGMILNALGRTKEIMHSSVLALLLNVMLNPLFYALMGTIGPAIATFSSIFIVMVYQLFQTAKYAGVPFRKIFPFANYGKIVVLNIVFGIVFYIIKLQLPVDQYVGNVVEAIILGVVWSGIYMLTMKSKIKKLWNKINNV